MVPSDASYTTTGRMLGGVSESRSVDFFEAQFRRQVREHDLALNPFELAALPHCRGRMLDYGCGLGNLAIAAAQRGCDVTAIDASPAAIDHLGDEAARRGLAIRALRADLRGHRLAETFDTIACIGLLMFFDRATALAQLAMLQAHVRPGGVLAVNVLVEGTTYMEMFDPASHCLFARDELERRLAGWRVLASEHAQYPAPGERIKAFHTLVAEKPATWAAGA